MSPRLPLIAAILVAAGTAVRMVADPLWLGDWNETGSSLGALGIFGSTMGALVLCIHIRRNVLPLSSLSGRTSTRRAVMYIVAGVLAPSGVSWVATCAVFYGITAVVTPAPSAPSSLPVVTATLAVLTTLVIGTVAGFFLHPAWACPLVVVAGFVGPAVLGVYEPSVAGNFTVSTSTSLDVQFAPVARFYLRQSMFFLSLSLGGLILAATAMTRSLRASVVLAVLAVLVCTGATLGTGPTERIRPAEVTTSMRCDKTPRVQVCLLSDHADQLPTALMVADEIAGALPDGAGPTVFRETGLPGIDGAARIDAAGVRSDVAAEVIDAAATWKVCDPEAGIDRPVWLAYRAGLLDELPPLETLDQVRVMPEAEQILWWTAVHEDAC